MITRLAGILLAQIVWLGPTTASAQPEVLDLKRRNILVEQVSLDSAFWLGLLRLRLVFSGSAPPTTWELTLRGDHDETIAVTADNAATRLSSTPDRSVLYLDVQLPPWNTLRATAGPSILEINTIEATVPSAATGLQIIDGSSVSYFDNGVGPKEIDVALSFGRLAVRTVDNSPQSGRTCTAFRVAKGYWLTAAHCVTRDPKGSPDAAAVAIQRHHYAGQQEPVSQLAARVAVTGQASGNWNPRERLGPDELDFALLEVPDDPGGPVFALRPTQESQNQTLQVLMHWRQIPAGKARSAGPACTLIKLVGTIHVDEADQCYRGIQHGCSTDLGASGAPLVRLDNPQHLVGMNYRGGPYKVHNCALPLAPIQQFLCNIKPELASKVTQCPKP